MNIPAGVSDQGKNHCYKDIINDLKIKYNSHLFNIVKDDVYSTRKRSCACIKLSYNIYSSLFLCFPIGKVHETWREPDDIFSQKVWTCILNEI